MKINTCLNCDIKTIEDNCPGCGYEFSTETKEIKEPEKKKKVK